MLERSPRGRPVRHQLINLLIVLDFLSLLIILILSSAYAATHISRKKEKLDAEKSLQNLSSEMNFLKSQINPHFLFNALNNIYSLTLTGSERSSEMILKLSEMLRYILYECSDAFVKIEKEWDYILNYVDFMQLKSKEKLNINLSFKNDHASSLITPMIFVPFIENAFKHSNVENSEVGYIHISLNNKENEILFQVDNSLSAEKQSRDEMGGIGLDNVKRRLELVYGSDFDLIINDTEDRYTVILRIQKSSPKNEKK
jgi:LytS/YehU family sensor histidine kinase